MKRPSPENARASPVKKRGYSLSTKLINGGERVAFSLMKVIDVQDITSDEDSTNSEESDSENSESENKKNTGDKNYRMEISVMLILQMVTIFIAIAW